MRIISSLPPIDVGRDLVEVYFNTLDQAVGSLFHRHSFQAAFEEQKVPVVLLLCVFALAARFSDHDYFRGIDRSERGADWSRQARETVNLQTLDRSVTSMQACFLASTLAGSDGDSDQESICSAMAIRMAQLSGLPYKLSSDPLNREIELRVWSSVYMLDIWTTTGRNIIQSVTYDPDWPWPLAESAFDGMRFNDLSHNMQLLNGSPARAASVWGQMIHLTYIKSKVHQLNYSLGKVEEPGPRFMRSVEELSNELRKWVFDLPQALQENEVNMAYFNSIGRGRVFVALHIGYHFYVILLFYRFLNNGLRADSTLRRPDYADRCKQHARALSDLLWDSSHDYDRRCMWPRIGHLLVISSSVHLHTLLTETNPEAVSQAREVLNRNFQMLTHLQHYWSNLGSSIERLKVFHEACLSAPEPENVFQMTEWLSKFVYEHANSVRSPTVDPTNPARTIME